MNQLRQIIIGLSVAAATTAFGQTLVRGGQFKDRIMPMQGSKTLATMKAENPDARIWGAPGVQNRFVDNGIEADGMNIWGGNVYKDADGLYHQYVAGWDGVSHPFAYWSNSHIYHFTSTTPYGPFENPTDIGKGHNPEIFRAKDGTYVVYALIGNSSCWRYTSKSPAGPWTFGEMPYNLRDRDLLTGSTTTYSNWTFAGRQDGSVLCMCRGGGIWISRDGLGEFGQVKGTSCYPNGGGGTFEDPVIWRDEVQYHMIVNDWQARKAYYSRSADGFHWVAEEGLAYNIEISVHPDGMREEWYKYERPRVFQDEHGRAIQLNMAVIDTIKAQDVANDNHSSKNIAMPLNPGLRLAVLNETTITEATAEIRVKVMREDGFDPSADLDIASLRFGNSTTVNNGGGATPISSATDADGNLILTFGGAGTELKDDEFAPKLMGRYTDGYTLNLETGTGLKPDFCYGYARLPYYNYTPAYLSPVTPVIGEGSMLTGITVENFGLSASVAGATVSVSAGGTLIATGDVPALEPYAAHRVTLAAIRAIPAGTKALTVDIRDGNQKTESATLQLTAAIAGQGKLAAVIAEALSLSGNDNYRYGRDELNEAVAEACLHTSSYCEAELTAAAEALGKAVNTFKYANATKNNPMSITLNDADMASLDGWTVVPEMTGSDPYFKVNNSNRTYGDVVSPFVEAWYSTGLADAHSISQTVGTLPAGRYAFSADVIAVLKHGTAGVELFANSSEVTCCTGRTSQHYSVDFTLSEPTDVTVGLRCVGEKTVEWLAMDNPLLIYYGDGSHDDDLFYQASIENVYIKGCGETANHYVTVEPDYDNYLNRYTNPTACSEWAKLTDSETGGIWLYNITTQSFIIPEGSFWQTSSATAQKTLALETSGTGYQIRFLNSGNRYMNAAGGFIRNRDITDGLKGYPICGYTSGVWEFQRMDDQSMPQFTLSDITTGLDELKAALAKLARAAVIEVPASGYATFCAPFDVTLPDGLKAYTAEVSADGRMVELTGPVTEIPAGTPVVLHADGGFGPYYVCGDSEAAEATCTGGALTGVLSAGLTMDTAGYVLQHNKDGEACFSLTDAGTSVGKNSCYIPILPAGCDELPITVKGTDTAVRGITHTDTKPNGTAYSLSGMRIAGNAAGRGIVVIDGEKHLVK